MPALVRSRMISRSLGQRSEDVEHKLAGPGRGIYALGQRPKSDAAIGEGVHGLGQVSHRAPEPVQPPHDQDVTKGSGIAPDGRKSPGHQVIMALRPPS
jgi:hypothetical protein